jgi:DNA-binding MarR family transcriptional regulator
MVHTRDVPQRPDVTEPPVSDDELATVMAAARAMVGVAAAALSQVTGKVTPQQLRVLVLASSRSPVNLAAVAADLDVHPSNATRTVDRLVDAGLLNRRPSRVDRRQVVLTLTPKGRTLVRSVMRHRERAVLALLGKVPEEDRRAVVAGLGALVAAAGEPITLDFWPEASR